MSKKLRLLGFSAIALVNMFAAGKVMADTKPVAGIADRRADIPYLEKQIEQQRQPAQVEVPKADDYRGTNTPLPPISTVTFNGPTVLGEEDLNRLAAPYLDRPLTDNDIAQLKNDITDEYTKHGYPLVKVATPTQDLNDGELTVNIYEGRIGQIIPQTSGGIIRDYVPIAFSQRLQGEIFNDQDAESVINDLNEINNTTSSITLKPGLAPLTTDLVLNVQPGGLEDVNYAAVDNYGNELTGEFVASLHLEKTNMFKAGEKLSFDGRISDEQLYAAGVGIRIPTGFRNTFFEASYLYSHNDIVDRLEFLNAEGQSHIINVGFTGNVINQDDSKLTLRAGMDIREHESFLSGVTDTNDHIRRVYVGATYLGLYPENSTALLVDAKLSKGVGILGASEEGDTDITRLNADPEAVMFEPSLFIRHDLTPDDMLTFYTRGQVSTNTLLSSDTFILGGYGSVRGFQPAQEVGDAGFTFSAEYQHKFPVPIGENSTLGVGPWIDGGHVYNRESGQTLDNALYAAGLGVELAADLVPVGPTKIRLDWAHPLGDYNSDEVDNNSFYFRIQQDF